MSYDSRFDEAEAEVDRGRAWRFREADAPNPLTIVCTEWSSGHTKLGAAEWLNGRDRNGVTWSILVGPAVLKRRLVDGEVSKWDEARGEYVVTEVLGRVQPGEVVSIKYTGDVEGAKYTYPNFTVSRKPPITEEVDESDAPDDEPVSAQISNADDLPF